MKRKTDAKPPLPPMEPLILDVHWTSDIIKLLLHIAKKQNEIDKKIDEIIEKLNRILESK